MIDYRNSPDTLLVITSPYYNEKLNEFLLTCDWDSLNRKWNKSNEDRSHWGYRESSVGFIFFAEQPNWREKYQDQIDSGEITAELLEENRPFDVLKDYVHKALDITDVDEPMFIFLPARPFDKIHLEEVKGQTSIELYTSDDILTQMEYFLEIKLNQHNDYIRQGRIHKRSQYDFLREQEYSVSYHKLSLHYIDNHVQELKERLVRTKDIQNQIIIQIQINIFNKMFLNGKLSVGNPDIEITSEDDILISGHQKVTISFGCAKDKTLYFYFLIRALQEQNFISYEDIKEYEWEQLEDLYKELKKSGKQDQELSIPNRDDFSQMFSRINKKFRDKIADHLVASYCITSQEPVPRPPKLYGIQTKPHRIKIHKSSSFGMYLRSKNLSHLINK